MEGVNFGSAWSVFWNFIGGVIACLVPAFLVLAAAALVASLFGTSTDMPDNVLALIVGAAVLGSACLLIGQRLGRREAERREQ